MNTEGLVLGLLDISPLINDPVVAAKYRGVTIAWSRYGYRDEIIEASTVDEILKQATQRGYRSCLILPYGHIIKERWSPEHWQSQDFFSALKTWVTQTDFLVAGALVGSSTTWFGFEHQCLLVNLDKYRQLSAPSFDVACDRSLALPRARPLMKQARVAELLPATGTDIQRPVLPGWNLIATSLRSGLPVPGFSEDLLDGMLNLSATCPSRTQAFARYLDEGLADYRCEDQHDELSDDQVTFLNAVKSQTANARHGVFLWNIESYADIETPRDDFKTPVSSLYSVAAGFKPNRILHTHGFDEATRVVYFDYSPRALEIRKWMVDEWDGQDFPDFVQGVFRVFPHPDTFYQLWDNLTPANVEPRDIEQMWERELNRWKGARVFREHWRSYRELQHEYVCCNILTDSASLFGHMSEESNGLIWWSNAFFTVYGNWFYTIDERKRIYDNWIKRIATINPKLYLFGSDYNNVNVNSIRAAEYWDQYRRADSNCLTPCRLFEAEIRM